VLLVNAVAIALDAGSRPLLKQLERQLFGAGHILVLAVLSAALTWVAASFTRGRFLPSVVFALVAGIVGAAVLPPDFENFAVNRKDAGSSLPWEWLGAVALILPVAASHALIGRLRAPVARVAAGVIGLALVIVLHGPWIGEYHGVLLFGCVTGALLLAAAVWPSVAAWLPGLTPRSGALALATVLLAGCAALAIKPCPTVWRALLDTPGSLLLPHLSKLMPFGGVTNPDPSLIAPAYRAARAPTPVTPPSQPALLSEDPLVIVITVDALRAELLLGERYARRLPALHALRAQSVSFEMARTPSPSTLVSLSSLFTGRYYSQLEWTKQGPENDPIQFLPELLVAAGYRTLHVANVKSPERASRGFQREVRTEPIWARAKPAMRTFLRELERDMQGRLFAYIHLVEPHAPYVAKKTGPRFERYLAEVKNVDREIGRLVAWLEQRGVWDRTVFVLSADHGEAFGEHGKYFHGFGNYEELVRVPLLIRVPGVSPRSVTAPVSLIDVRPTLLDLIGANTPGTDMGQSLVPFLRGQDPELARPIVMDAGRRIQAMVFRNGMKVIRDIPGQSVELYDLLADPGEQRNLADDARELSRYLGTMNAFFAAHELRRPGYEIPWRRF
jgi:hypothetical protein